MLVNALKLFNLKVDMVNHIFYCYIVYNKTMVLDIGPYSESFLKAPEMHHKYLRNRLNFAQDRGDKESEP